MKPTYPSETVLIHGTCIDFDGVGLALCGPPGAGKSDLALRAIDQPGCGLAATSVIARLVADDQIVLSLGETGLIASCRESIRGRMEVRGIGIVECPYVMETHLVAVVNLVANSDMPRFSEGGMAELAGVALPGYALDPFEPSACAKLRVLAAKYRMQAHQIVIKNVREVKI